ncbi:MAG: FAD-dependent oxidoreductase [Chloroflexi bacterium]|nr:FAD-dependent oxidoreductase [Chloroflexota bacterium]
MTQTYAIDAIIVGAGIAGLMAAHVLKDAGKEVIVLDKGRSPGGRLATRRIGAGAADHGAQFFTVRTPEFGVFVERWLADGLVFEWARGWTDGSLVTTRDGHPRYAARGGMNSLAKTLAEGLQIFTEVQATALRQNADRWLIDTEGKGQFGASAVLLTPPVPQSLTLLDAGGVKLTDRDRQALESIQYELCLTAMLLTDRPLHIPAPGAIQRENANIHWVADNRAKGISPQATILTMQATGVYSRQLWEQTDESILNAFRVDVMPLLGGAKVVEAQLKRWRYSRPISVYPERTLIAENLPRLAFAGDAFGGPRVEGAVLSGLAAGQTLAEAL